MPSRKRAGVNPAPTKGVYTLESHKTPYIVLLGLTGEASSLMHLRNAWTPVLQRGDGFPRIRQYSFTPILQHSALHTRYGAELVSPILSGIGGLVEVYQAMQFLNEIKGVNIDGSCGFHVHHGVDRDVYRCENLKELVRLVHPMESLFYLLIPGERQNKSTCRPMEIDVKAFLQDCDPECGPSNCRLKKLWYSPENRYDPESAKYPRYDTTRYHGLNLHSYWFRSTIEFRYHSAVLHHVDDAMQWIIFSQFLVEMSQGNIPTIQFHNDGNKWLQTIYVIYHSLGYSDRIKFFPS